MAPNVRIIGINDCVSDGDRSKWPTNNQMTRNDNYFLERIANSNWAKDLGTDGLGAPVSSATWRLDKLPDGYAGFEKKRNNELHIDRYIYGHPNGQFRSIAEFYPHFKHLMDVGGPVGCTCVRCTGTVRKKPSQGSGKGATSSSSQRSASPTRSSSYFSKPTAKLSSLVPSRQPDTNPSPPRGRPSGVALLPQGRLPSPPPPAKRRKQADEDRTQDVYRGFIDKLKASGEDGKLDEAISEFASPDWAASHEQVKVLLDDWAKSPRYIPRIGEVVLFARQMNDGETLAWDRNLATWQKVDVEAEAWLGRPKWEAGIVTQMPIETVGASDLEGVPAAKRSNVVRSGFRIEPLSEPGNNDKIQSKRHHYVPLHALRPMALWRDCLAGLKEEEWHPTVPNALTTSNTVCVLAKHRFKGAWDAFSGPNATIFCRGAYIGSDLLLVGDVVSLLPNPQEQKQDAVTDILIVTGIKVRLVNIKEAGDDDWDEGHPYNTCLHVSGRAYTLDTTRSFDGVGKLPLSSKSRVLPSGLVDYGQWYHITDPNKPKDRLEVPFTRVMGRVPESIAMKTWYEAPTDLTPPSAFHAVNASKGNQSSQQPIRAADISRGLSALFQAREHASKHDPRIDQQAGKSWFWADTRVEALDLHEVNGRFVGVADDTRTPKQLDDWHKALKALGGSQGDLEKYDAVKKKREAEEAEQHGNAGYGMVGASVTVPVGESGTGGDRRSGGSSGEDEEMADVSEDVKDEDDGGGDAMIVDPRAGGSRLRHGETIELSDDEDS